MSTNPYAERVQSGMAWLDANQPASWIDEIDIHFLNLRYPHECICGQIENEGFYKFIWKHDLSKAQSAAFGFSLLHDREPALASDYAKLTTAWRRAIRKRRAVANT